MKKLFSIVPNEYIDKLPASIFFVEKKKVIIEQPNLHYAKSKLYNTEKMRCYSYYKPAFL